MVQNTMLGCNGLYDETTTKSKELDTLAQLTNNLTAIGQQIAGFAYIDFEVKAKLQAYCLLLAATAEKELYNKGGVL